MRVVGLLSASAPWTINVASTTLVSSVQPMCSASTRGPWKTVTYAPIAVSSTTPSTPTTRSCTSTSLAAVSRSKKTIQSSDSFSRGHGRNHQRTVQAPATSASTMPCTSPTGPATSPCAIDASTAMVSMTIPPAPSMNLNRPSAEWDPKVSTSRR